MLYKMPETKFAERRSTKRRLNFALVGLVLLMPLALVSFFGFIGTAGTKIAPFFGIFFSWEAQHQSDFLSWLIDKCSQESLFPFLAPGFYMIGCMGVFWLFYCVARLAEKFWLELKLLERTVGQRT